MPRVDLEEDDVVESGETVVLAGELVLFSFSLYLSLSPFVLYQEAIR